MDLLRRSGSGELAELFGEVAVPLDKSHRLHGFRRTAEKSFALLPPEQRALLEAYAAGVNSGLASLPRSPWEYLVLRTSPQPWRAEDCLLVAFAMWFDLQDASAQLELSMQAVRETLGASASDFFAPRGSSWDAPLDGSTFPAPALPGLRMQAAATRLRPTPEKLLPGSNSFAVGAAHTGNGRALVATDMHLNLNLPHIWYRAVLRWTDSAGTARHVVGVTLPGEPVVIAGSNGSIAWGFTNSYLDSMDVVRVETEATAGAFYRTAGGFGEVQDRVEIIKVRGGEPVTYPVRWTEWGPIFGRSTNGQMLALRWSAHDPEATNLELIELENAKTVADAVAVAHRAAMPNQNLVVADTTGAIAWTLTGRIPRRVGYDGRYPASWAYGDRRWDGWLKPEEIPVISNPAEGLLWTANQRLVGGDAYARLGDGGYDEGVRAKQIRDDVRALVASGKKATPADLLAIQLDDRAAFLERWKDLMLATLTDAAVSEKSARGELREAVRHWEGRAGIDSASYRLVRAWRREVADLAFAPFFDQAAASFPNFSYKSFLYEDALWRFAHEQPPQLLNPRFASWNALLLAAADNVLSETDHAGEAPGKFVWGDSNQLRMQHPFSRVLPGIFGRLFDMPSQPLPGDTDMPRVQSPSFGASERMIVSPGHEDEALFHMPGGQSGHPLSPYYRAGHAAWVEGKPTPLLPGPAEHVLTLQP